jgi:hypothetical protein
MRACTVPMDPTKTKTPGRGAFAHDERSSTEANGSGLSHFNGSSQERPGSGVHAMKGIS